MPISSYGLLQYQERAHCKEIRHKFSTFHEALEAQQTVFTHLNSWCLIQSVANFFSVLRSRVKRHERSTFLLAICLARKILGTVEVLVFLPYGHSSVSPRMSLMEDHYGKNEMDIKFQIHSMEKEVLRAFIAQSDILSWGKEGLITELQKELNVTDIEHGQILVKINSDELVKMIREWRKGAHESLSTKVSASGHFTDSVDNALLKKRRPARPPLSKNEQYVSHDKPYLASIPSFALAQFRNNQQCVELPFSPMESTKIVNHNLQGVLSNKQGEPSQSHLSNGFHTSSTCKFKNCSECFEIRATDTVINEVKQMAYGTENPDPIQLQKALFISQ